MALPTCCGSSSIRASSNLTADCCEPHVARPTDCLPSNPMNRLASLLLLIGSCTIAESAVRAADPTYWQDVRPVLRKHCTVCHNQRNLKEVDVSGGIAL